MAKGGQDVGAGFEEVFVKVVFAFFAAAEREIAFEVGDLFYSVD